VFDDRKIVTFITASILTFSLLSPAAMAQNPKCTAKGLSSLLSIDLQGLTKKKLEVSFGRSMGGSDINAYYVGQTLNAVTASFKSGAGMADMNFYFQDKDNYLMEYHIMQNSNYYEEPDSVVLTDEKSYYHVCDNSLLSPAFGGVIDEDIYQNMKLVLDVILTEESAQ
jgi:hypothetical protein